MDPWLSPFRNRCQGNGIVKGADTVGRAGDGCHIRCPVPLTPAGNPEKVAPVAVVVA